MCGIFGIWNLDGKQVDLTAVQDATTRLRHRGPDDEGYLLVNTRTRMVIPCGGHDTDPRIDVPMIETLKHSTFNLALGFRRLSILDLSPFGHQPMCSANGRFWIIFNGEIYNYLELRAELSEKGYKFHTETDTEVILTAYQEWDHDCVSRFIGMWAFAIWDTQKRNLFLSRDRFGIKPLYYIYDGCKIAFASEIKALVGRGGISFEPNERVIYQYLIAGWLPESRTEETFFQQVHLLTPGYSLMVSERTMERQQYWNLNLTRQEGRLNVAESIEGFRQLFVDAVRLQLRSDVPVGSCLSGGLDSSSIVGVINKLMRQGGTSTAKMNGQQKTFSVVYKTPGPYNESQYIERVLLDSCAEGYFTFPTLERLRSEIEQLVWHQDEPFLSTSMFAQWCVMSLVREHGVKVLLDGQGADELLGGYAPFSIYLGEFLRYDQIYRAMIEAQAIRKVTDRSTMLLLGRALITLLPSPLLDLLLKQQERVSMDWSVLNRDFSARWNRETLSDWRHWSDQRDLGSHLRYVLQEQSLPRLLRFEDRNSMAFGVEARVPYLDHRLVEYAFNQAAPYRIYNGWTKWVLRMAMEDIIPGEIIWRKKKIGFETPEAEWLFNWICSDKDLFGNKAASENYLDMGHIRKRITMWIEGGGKDPSLPLWRWINLEFWLRNWRRV